MTLTKLHRSLLSRFHEKDTLSLLYLSVVCFFTPLASHNNVVFMFGFLLPLCPQVASLLKNGAVHETRPSQSGLCSSVLTSPMFSHFL